MFLRAVVWMAMQAAYLLPAAAQTEPRALNPVHWSIGKATAGHGKPGSRFAVQVYAAIDPGWHLYALAGPDDSPLATEIAVAKNDPVQLLRVDQGRPKRLPGEPSLVFDGSAGFVLRLQAAPHTAGDAIHVLLRYQACNDRMCLPVRRETLLVPLR